MTYQMTENEAKVVNQFTMKPTKRDGAGRGVMFHVKVVAYRDGTVYLYDEHNPKLHEIYGPQADAANVLRQLIAPAVET
ncbi:MAG: hypothetical protein ABI068_01400 [Ktedonobacterales bacterium]